MADRKFRMVHAVTQNDLAEIEASKGMWQHTRQDGIGEKLDGEIRVILTQDVNEDWHVAIILHLDEGQESRIRPTVPRVDQVM
jgi:hypothetical protein